VSTRKKPPATGRKAQSVRNGLNLKQAAFVAAYTTNGGDGKNAALAAGYGEKGAGQQASRLLTMPRVRAEVQRITAAGAERAEITVERIMDELALGGFADITDFVEFDGAKVTLKPSHMLDAAKRRAIVEVSETMNGVKIKLMNKLGALERMGQQIGMFKHQVELPSDPATGQPLGLILVPYKAPAPIAPPPAPPEPAGGDDGD
jgi:phage terminase small subunit